MAVDLGDYETGGQGQQVRRRGHRFDVYAQETTNDVAVGDRIVEARRADSDVGRRGFGQVGERDAIVRERHLKHVEWLSAGR